ncbi:hypothetical protein QBC37DRAFT_292999 [Rhypophila decipiens]|uniref:N-acetyltransferase domain-containing protein n=1 Tax=Rhypophila decipiens TaxID=261697 RepID=A0AAN7B448_9PEZI|nr:hypothetical protein QBC37DRAFT_292999 [Rhypophila decipiens]
MWRQIQLPDDMPGLVHVGDIVHPSLPESPAVFTERATLFPEGFLVLADSECDPNSALNNEPAAPSGPSSSRIYGYAISHPIPHDQPPALDSLLGSIPTNTPDNSNLNNDEPAVKPSPQYYIHDIAILPAFRGQGLAAQCIRLLLDVAKRHGYKTTCLISVYGTSEFWGKFGFLPPENLSDVLKEKVKGYGEDAVYLVRREVDGEA